MVKPITPKASPAIAPKSVIKRASNRKSDNTVCWDAPSAFSRPISGTRCETLMSVIFIISIPATTRLIVATARTTSVKVWMIFSKDFSRASWVTNVISRSPAWRAAIRFSTAILAGLNNLFTFKFDNHSKQARGVK